MFNIIILAYFIFSSITLSCVFILQGEKKVNEEDKEKREASKKGHKDRRDVSKDVSLTYI